MFPSVSASTPLIRCQRPGALVLQRTSEIPLGAVEPVVDDGSRWFGLQGGETGPKGTDGASDIKASAEYVERH